MGITHHPMVVEFDVIDGFFNCSLFNGNIGTESFDGFYRRIPLIGRKNAGRKFTTYLPEFC